MHERPEQAAAQDFSLAQARSIVADLFRPNMHIYWTDFLLTYFVGQFFAAGVRFLPMFVPESPWLWPLQGLCFVASGLLFYRAFLFIHELVHLPQGKFKAFRLVWNLLCGVPFLIPSFVYYPHLDHHRRKHFGTSEDGEYMPLGLRSWWHTAGYLALCPLIPLAAMLRFGIITPLTWLHPAIRRFVHRHASSMVMNPAYLRPLPEKKALRIIFWQELACFLALFTVFFVALVFLNRWPTLLLLQGYCTSLFVVIINAVRTLGSHRWWNDGREMTFVEQLLDSVTVDKHAWISELWGPVGTRFHSLHHLFPSLPYHNLGEAHRRLMAQLPADSLYRRTVEHSLTAALVGLARRTAEAGRAANLSGNLTRETVT